MSKQVYPSDATKRRVLAASGNQCAHPDCMELIFDLEHETMLGKIAHIKARRPDGARYDVSQTDEERNSFPNLFALCGKHHDIIDDNEARYPATMLYKWKKNHEQKIAHSLDRSWIIAFPSSIIQGFAGGGSIRVDYWVDNSGKMQIYTQEQLVVCQALQDLHLLEMKLHELLGQIEQVEDVSQIPWIKAEARKIKLNKYGLIGTFHEYFQIAKDVKFFEYTIATVQDGHRDRKRIAEDADRLLEEKASIQPKNPKVS